MSESMLRKVVFSGRCFKLVFLGALMLTAWILARYSYITLPQAEFEIAFPMFMVLLSTSGITLRNALRVISAPAYARSRK